MKIVKTTFLVFLFILSSMLSCSKTNLDPTELEPIDLSEINVNNLPYKFEIIKLLSPYGGDDLIPCDLDNDGKDELINISNVRAAPTDPSFVTLLAIDPGRVIEQTNFEGHIQSSAIVYINKDGENDILLYETTNDSTYINVLSEKGKPLDRFLIATNPHVSPKKWFGGIQAEALMDVNEDGYDDILFKATTDYAYQPRGILAYDHKNKEILWEYRTGFVPTAVCLLDISGDGKREILFGSSAPNNGNGETVNGTDDSKVYLTVLDSLGNLLRSQSIGVKSSKALLHVHDINGDNKNKIIVHYSCNRDTTQDSSIALWDPNTWQLGLNISLSKNLLCDIVFLDSDTDGKDDIFIAWEDGNLEFRNYKFQKILSRHFPNFYPKQLLLEDLKNDGEKEICVSGEFNGEQITLLLNKQLDLLAYLDCDYSIIKTVRTGFGKEKLMIAVDGEGARKVLIALKKHYKVLSLEFWKQFGLGLIMGILLSGIFLGFHFSSKYRLKLKMSLNSIIDSLSEGVAIFDYSGKIIIINHSLEKIFQFKKENIIGLNFENIFTKEYLPDFYNIIELSYKNNHSFLEKEVTLKQNMHSVNLLIEIGNIKLADYKKPFKLLIVKDITSSVQSTRTIAWATMAQKLAHEIKTPLSTVMLTAQRIELGIKNDAKLNNKFGKYLSKIIRQVDRLRQLTDSFMKFAKLEKPKFEKLNLNNLITKALIDLQTIIGSNIEIRKTFTEDMPLIRVDRNQILIALKNIVNNSLKAMEGAGIVTITTRLVQSLQKQGGQNNIQIEITDTGKGISKQDKGQLFQPFFSNSPGGTGLGLVIVKKIIEDHKGSIKIESEEGIGTTVVITLPCTE
jgi:PAS domain S-box-containing protein